MGIFAHPDDESMAAPILVKYREQGARVIIVTATDGRLGTNEYSICLQVIPWLLSEEKK